jgi:hypothetical protein
MKFLTKLQAHRAHQVPPEPPALDDQRCQHYVVHQRFVVTGSRERELRGASRGVATADELGKQRRARHVHIEWLLFVRVQISIALRVSMASFHLSLQTIEADTHLRHVVDRDPDERGGVLQAPQKCVLYTSAVT